MIHDFDHISDWCWANFALMVEMPDGPTLNLGTETDYSSSHLVGGKSLSQLCFDIFLTYPSSLHWQVWIGIMILTYMLYPVMAITLPPSAHLGYLVQPSGYPISMQFHLLRPHGYLLRPSKLFQLGYLISK